MNLNLDVVYCSICGKKILNGFNLCEEHWLEKRRSDMASVPNKKARARMELFYDEDNY